MDVQNKIGNNVVFYLLLVLSFMNKINFFIAFILFNPQVYVVFVLFCILFSICFLLLIYITSMWNKSIGSNFGGGKQSKTQRSMIWQKKIRQIPTLEGALESCPILQTWRKDSRIGIYCLEPSLEGQQITIGHQVDSLGELLAR